MKSSVFVLGSINNDIVVTSDRHPNPGETLHGSDLAYYPGGKGANQAVAASRAGAGTHMIGCVGTDAVGSELKDYLEKSGIDVSYIDECEGPTGTALITVAGGENTIVIVAGANAKVSDKLFQKASIKEGDILVAQFETPIDVTTNSFKVAKQIGALTILNPAPADKISQQLLDVTNYLVVNEHEYSIVFGCDENYEELKNKPDYVQQKFAGTLVVTLGEKGVLVLTDEQRIRVEGQKVDVVDSTGAGDCFVGYFAAMLSQDKILKEAIEIANKAASISVAKNGAAVSIPDIDELLLRSN